MLCCPEKAVCFLVCVFVLLVLRSSFSGEKNIWWIVVSVAPSGGLDVEMQV